MRIREIAQHLGPHATAGWTKSAASRSGQPWAFSDRHAELAHALHFEDLSFLAEIDWSAMSKTYWSDVKEVRQAEFLVKRFFPWSAVHEIGVLSEDVAAKVQRELGAAHRPPVVVRRAWYY